MQNKQRPLEINSEIHQQKIKIFIFGKDFGIWWTLLLFPIYCLFLTYIFGGEFNQEKQNFHQLSQKIEVDGKEKTLKHLGLIFSLEKKNNEQIIHTEQIPQWEVNSQNRFKDNFYILHMSDGQNEGVVIEDFNLSTPLDVIARKDQYKKFRVKCLIQRNYSTLNSKCYFFPKSPWHDPQYKGVSPQYLPKDVNNKFIINSIIDYKFSRPKIISIDLNNSYVDTTKPNYLVPTYQFDESLFLRAILFIVCSVGFIIIGFSPLKLLKLPISLIHWAREPKNNNKNERYNSLPKVHSEILKKKK